MPEAILLFRTQKALVHVCTVMQLVYSYSKQWIVYISMYVLLSVLSLLPDGFELVTTDCYPNEAPTFDTPAIAMM